MSVNTLEKFNARGDLQVTRKDAATGEIISVWEKKNVITFGGTDIMVRLLSPNAAFGATVQAESQVKSIRLGIANTTPQRTDTDLASEAVVGNPVRVELQDANRVLGASGTVEFSATLGAAEGNGVTYREAGLFTRGTADDPLVTTGATLFARQVFPDQPKTAAVELSFRWRITFSV